MAETTMEHLQNGDWHYENITPDLIQVERVTKVLYEARTAYQHVLVQDTASLAAVWYSMAKHSPQR